MSPRSGSLPRGAAGVVFEDVAEVGELIADGVGKIVLLGGAQGGAGVYEQVDEGVYVCALVGIGFFEGETEDFGKLFERGLCV